MAMGNFVIILNKRDTNIIVKVFRDLSGACVVQKFHQPRILKYEAYTTIMMSQVSPYIPGIQQRWYMSTRTILL